MNTRIKTQKEATDFLTLYRNKVIKVDSICRIFVKSDNKEVYESYLKEKQKLLEIEQKFINTFKK